MIRLKGLDHIVLRVRDAEAMAEFYCRIVGCAVLRRTSTGLTQLTAGASVIDLMTVDAPRREAADQNLDHFCLAVEDFDIKAVAAHLAGLGVPTRNTQRGSLFLIDPEGNRVELTGAQARRAPVAEQARQGAEHASI